MKQFSFETHHRSEFVNIDKMVQQVVTELGIKSGVITVFSPHSTGGLTINENADPDVVADMADILEKMVPWKAGYRHGEGNSAAHAKASLMGSSVRVIVENGRLQLGTWQSIYFCEFDGPRSRQVWIMAGDDTAAPHP